MLSARSAAALTLLLACLTVLMGIRNASALEQAQLRTTDYPVPADAIFVSPKGSDTHNGDPDYPLRTISAAIRLAEPGSTIVIRKGTYRETLPALTKPLILQPFPGEAVWLKGSAVVGDWRRKGNAWIRDNWPFHFCGDCFHPGNIDPRFPNAGLPDQLFVDGRPLAQVASRNSLAPGTFFVDVDANRIFLHDDPRGHIVEAAVFANALTLFDGAQGSIIRGLGFAHYSPVAEPGLGAAVKIDTGGVVFEDNVVAWSAVKGLAVFGPGVTVRGNAFLHNGMMGMAAWRADGLQVLDNRFAFNNREGFARSGAVSEAAGAKITRSTDIVVTGNRFEDNRANGLWLDLSVSHAVIAGNLMRNNAMHGLFYEISANATIVANVLAGNDQAGVALANSSRLRVFNNSIIGNRYGLVVQNDGRLNEDADEIARGIDWIAGDTVFANNIVAASPASKEPLIWVRDFADQLRPDDMLTLSGHNGYLLDAGSSLFAEWWTGGEQTVFADLAAFRAATGKEANSIVSRTKDASLLSGLIDRQQWHEVLPFFEAAPGMSLPAPAVHAMGRDITDPPRLGAPRIPAFGDVPRQVGQ